MLSNGYIMLFRSLLDWQWYNNIPTKTVFIHLLLSVNYEPQCWQGVTINRGQRVSSYGKIATETGLSVQSVRTAIKHLISTGELTHEKTTKYSVFTVVNYDKFQSLTHELTANQQTTNKQLTTKEESNKDNKAIKDICAFFEKLWEQYPNKRGKAKVSARAKREMDKMGYDKMAACIEKYVRDKPDWQQYQNGSTFFNGGYLDYLKNSAVDNASAPALKDSEELKAIKEKLRK